jgi:type II secretory pathway pseudopilin PulG
MMLPALVVGLAIVGTLMTTIMLFASSSMRTARRVATMGEHEDLRNLIRIRTDCARTHATWGTSGVLVLRDRSGAPLGPVVGSNAMMFGKWRVTPTGYDAATGAIAMTVGGSGEPDVALFKGVPFVCRP